MASSDTSSTSSDPIPTPPSSMSASSSYIIPDARPSSGSSSNGGGGDGDDDSGEIDSLPSTSSEDFGSDSDLDESVLSGGSDAQREWEASLDQLELLMTMVLMPFAGKYLGRRFAYWSWARYMEWMHNVEIRWTSKKTFVAAGALEAAATI